MNYLGAENYILVRLRDELPASLVYHGCHHTIDVCKRAIEIAGEEGVKDENELTLLKTAALYHDSGFLSAYKGHEVESCLLVKTILPSFDYTNLEIDTICNMIMVTKIPQSPKTRLEKILADADLDYLGREDFYPIAYTLFQELQSIGVVQSEEEWNRIQVNFLENHHYFTATSIAKRKAAKDKHLIELKKRIHFHE